MSFIAHLRRKHEHFRSGILPRILPKSRFFARIPEKPGDVPAIFQSDLRKKKPPTPLTFHEEAVDTDPDVAGILHHLEGRENGDLERSPLEFLLREG
jgi:hypothetical protein